MTTHPTPPTPPPAQPPEKIKMEALQDGSIHGFPFKTGDTLEIEEVYVEALQRQGLAVRTDRVEIAKREREAAEKAAKDRAAAAPQNPVVSAKS